MTGAYDRPLRVGQSLFDLRKRAFQGFISLLEFALPSDREFPLVELQKLFELFIFSLGPIDLLVQVFDLCVLDVLFSF